MIRVANCEGRVIFIIDPEEVVCAYPDGASCHFLTKQGIHISRAFGSYANAELVVDSVNTAKTTNKNQDAHLDEC